MAPNLRILIDPIIKDKYGQEICWTWRLLLSSIGYSWKEVPFTSSDCDVAYLSSTKSNVDFKLCIHADIRLWDQRAKLRLADLKRSNGLPSLLYGNYNSDIPSLSVNDGNIICEKDLIHDVFWLSTGQEEKHWDKNKHGHVILPNDLFLNKQVFCMPPVSGIICWLEKKLLDIGFPPPIPRWPSQKKAAASLSHDVDYPEVYRYVEPLRIVLRQGLIGVAGASAVILGKKNYWNFPSWVHVEKKLGVRSAFYFVPIQGSLLKYAFGLPDPFYDVNSEQFRKLFQFLSDEGFEIGLHASYLAYKDRKKIEAEKQKLQKISNQRILGNRHHYWHLHPDDPESTLKIHEEIDLSYDTSLTHEMYIGWRRGVSWPFFPFHQKERRELKTLQISTVWMDNHLFGHLRYNPGDRYETLKALTKTTAEQGGCLLMDVHDYVYDDLLFPGWSKTYLWLIEHIMGRSDFWIATPGEIAEHWINRYNSIVEQSEGLKEGMKNADS